MICYDISDVRCRRRVVAALADAGAHRVQESVFEGWFLRRDVDTLLAEIAPVVRDDGGSLRVYPISSATAGRKAVGLMPAKAERTGHWIC